MELSESDKERIRKVLKLHYGISTSDNEIRGIDEGLRNNYVVMHEQRVIEEIVTRHISGILLKHRTKENVGWLEGLFIHKSIFHYLTYASMCYRAGIPLATIFLCRTAIEAGLRERIAEKKAEETGAEVWKEIERLTRKKLFQLELIAERKGLIDKGDIDRFFAFRIKSKNAISASRQLLDKYIHADFSSIAQVLEDIGVDMRVFTPKTPLEEKKIQAEVSLSEVAIIVLVATTLLAERLYLAGQ